MVWAQRNFSEGAEQESAIPPILYARVQILVVAYSSVISVVHFHEINISIWPISVPYTTLDVGDYCMYLYTCVEFLRIFICSSSGWCCIIPSKYGYFVKIIYDM